MGRDDMAEAKMSRILIVAQPFFFSENFIYSGPYSFERFSLAHFHAVKVMSEYTCNHYEHSNESSQSLISLRGNHTQYRIANLTISILLKYMYVNGC